ncbi:MAG: hypothetical protein ACLP1Q_09120 [Solirubrobacteraceae bacterium]|jgi:hypothetical protein
MSSTIVAINAAKSRTNVIVFAHPWAPKTITITPNTMAALKTHIDTEACHHHFETRCTTQGYLAEP